MILYALDDDDEPAAQMHSSASSISDEARCATEQTPDTNSATENYDYTGLPVELPTETASLTASLVELKGLASDMGEKNNALILEALRSSRMQYAPDNTEEIGITYFAQSALKPVEAQGRGFTHSHEKVIYFPRPSADRSPHHSPDPSCVKLSIRVN